MKIASNKKDTMESIMIIYLASQVLTQTKTIDNLTFSGQSCHSYLEKTPQKSQQQT
jgi:hypothetical protein